MPTDAQNAENGPQQRTQARKPSALSSGMELVPQPHGGALVPGAGGGPQPGSGRPPSWFRERCRELLAEDIDLNGKRIKRIEFAAAVMDGEVPEASAADRLRAWQELVKIGIPTQTELSGPDGTAVPVEVVIRLQRPSE
jgi:hypothetical protein